MRFKTSETNQSCVSGHNHSGTVKFKAGMTETELKLSFESIFLQYKKLKTLYENSPTNVGLS